VRNPRLRPILQLAAAIPFALPFVVIGFALLSFAGMVMPQLQGTMALVVLADVAVSFSFVYWVLDGAMTAADVRRLSDAASACGASTVQTLFRVVLPNIRSGLVTAAILAFALAIGEFALVKVLAGSLNTIPLWTARAMEASGGGLAPAAVVTTIVFVMLFALSAITAYVNRGRSSGEISGIGELGVAGQR
jgi:putative spermidine/putrescine transport system permease protein